MFHRLPRLAAAIALVAVVGACSTSTVTPSTAPTTAVAPAAGGVVTIKGGVTGSVVVIPKNLGNAYFDAGYVGIQNAAKVFGGTTSQTAPAKGGDPTAQIAFIQTATTQKAKAILVSAEDSNSIAPALTAAKAAGVKVVMWDSNSKTGAYDVFVNQVNIAGLGKSLADMACDTAPSCTGDIAILSTSQTATNQNAWIAAMADTMKDAKYAGLKLVATVYGNDAAADSTTQAQALIAAHPNLKVIVAPTTVGILAAAQVVQAKNLQGKVAVVGLGTPKSMSAYIKDGSAPEVMLWNTIDLGYLAYAVAAGLVSGELKGTDGEQFIVPTLNSGQPFTIVNTDKNPGDGSTIANEVVLGPPTVFNKANIDDWVTKLPF
jgi:rhamnose transport system substrate-binding protein